MVALDTLLDRIPHRGPMRFLTEVLEVQGAAIRTSTTIGQDFILARDGVVSPLVAIELFAQSAAAFMAHRTAASDSPFVQGALLGSRKLDVFVDAFHVGDVLVAECEEVFGAGALAQFRCVLTRGDDKVAEGAINVVSGADVVRG
ncbi:MAG: hypothetical protein AAGE52_20460 [Myxococcota bacterium]